MKLKIKFSRKQLQALVIYSLLFITMCTLLLIGYNLMNTFQFSGTNSEKFIQLIKLDSHVHLLPERISILTSKSKHVQTHPLPKNFAEVKKHLLTIIDDIQKLKPVPALSGSIARTLETLNSYYNTLEELELSHVKIGQSPSEGLQFDLQIYFQLIESRSITLNKNKVKLVSEAMEQFSLFHQKSDFTNLTDFYQSAKHELKKLSGLNLVHMDHKLKSISIILDMIESKHKNLQNFETKLFEQTKAIQALFSQEYQDEFRSTGTTFNSTTNLTILIGTLVILVGFLFIYVHVVLLKDAPLPLPHFVRTFPLLNKIFPKANQNTQSNSLPISRSDEETLELLNDLLDEVFSTEQNEELTEGKPTLPINDDPAISLQKITEKAWNISDENELHLLAKEITAWSTQNGLSVDETARLMAKIIESIALNKDTEI